MKMICKRGLCLLLTVILTAGLLSALTIGASALSLAERQQGIVAVAWAYYDKGHSVQYDGSTLVDDISRGDGGKTRSTYETSPEGATPNETMYTVCSDFAYQVYYEAYRYRLVKREGSCWTRPLAEYEPVEPATVWAFDEAKDKDREQEIQKMLSIAQPGDIFTAYNANAGTGHTMIIVGDVLGDGKGYMLHSGGDAYKPKTKKETREYKLKDDPEIDERYGKSILADGNGGSIRLTVAADYIPSHYNKKSFNKLALVRPLLEMTEQEYPMTPATAYRVSHPRLAIDRTLNKSRFNSVTEGEVVTMTLKLSNSSGKDYTVPVTEKVPAGAKLKKAFEGATASGDTMTWNVELKAGETKTFTAEYEITAKRGEQVSFTGGSVGDIPSNTNLVTVGGKKLTAEENAKLAAVAKGEYDKVLKDAKADNKTLGDVIYQKVLGLNVQLPTFQTVTKQCLKGAKTNYGEKQTNVFLKRDEVPAESLTAYQTLVPTCWGGAKLWCPLGSDRCADPRDKHLEPGDVLVRSDNIASASMSEQLVYLGEGKYLRCDTKKALTIVEEPEFVYSLNSKIFYVLRPTLAYDDVHALPALPAAAPDTLKFTDVKESDWFYTYVKDLVDRGTVSGMTATTFEPNGNLTYGQALKLIALAVGEAEPAKSGSHWASGYLTLAKEKKWLESDVDLDGKITRLQLCRIAAKAKGLTKQPETNPFKDTKDPDVLALNKAGIISGMTATTFEPNGLLTRAQIAKIIWTMLAV